MITRKHIWRKLIHSPHRERSTPAAPDSAGGRAASSTMISIFQQRASGSSPVPAPEAGGIAPSTHRRSRAIAPGISKSSVPADARRAGGAADRHFFTALSQLGDETEEALWSSIRVEGSSPSSPHFSHEVRRPLPLAHFSRPSRPDRGYGLHGSQRKTNCFVPALPVKHNSLLDIISTVVMGETSPAACAVIEVL